MYIYFLSFRLQMERAYRAERI